MYPENAWRTSSISSASSACRSISPGWDAFSSRAAALAARPWLCDNELPGIVSTVRARVGAAIAETLERRSTINLIDYILDLFRDEGHAQAFVANPDQALADAGLSTVSSAQLQSVAATAIPSLALGGSGDPVTDLQQAVSNHYGFEPQPDFSPQTAFSPSTALASNNSFMSPTTNITDGHSVSFGMGDITLGDKTTAHGDGAVAVGGSTHGDIVSGDGAVLGNGNTVNNGDTAAGGDVLSSHDGTVIQTSGHGTTTVSDSNTTSVHGNQTITDIHGTGDTSAVDNSSTLTHTSTIDNSQHDSSVHSSSTVDTSVHDNSVHDTSLHDNSIHETTHTATGLDAHLGL